LILQSYRFLPHVSFLSSLHKMTFLHNKLRRNKSPSFQLYFFIFFIQKIFFILFTSRNKFSLCRSFLMILSFYCILLSLFIIHLHEFHHQNAMMLSSSREYDEQYYTTEYYTKYTRMSILLFLPLVCSFPFSSAFLPSPVSISASPRFNASCFLIPVAHL